MRTREAELEAERDAEIERLTAELDEVRANQETATAQLDGARQRIAELETSSAQLSLQLAARDTEISGRRAEIRRLSQSAPAG